MHLALSSVGVKDLSILNAFDPQRSGLFTSLSTLPEKSPSDLYGSAPHTDFGCLTLLAQDDVGVGKSP